MTMKIRKRFKILNCKNQQKSIFKFEMSLVEEDYSKIQITFIYTVSFDFQKPNVCMRLFNSSITLTRN